MVSQTLVEDIRSGKKVVAMSAVPKGGRIMVKFRFQGDRQVAWFDDKGNQVAVHKEFRLHGPFVTSR